ncbi:MAG: polysaccharide biosynthesis C-terminal domain-containing protein [Planctomycetota bacterium]
MAEISAKSLSRHTIVYAFGNIVSRSVGFLLIPFYTEYLTTGDYGVLDIVDVTVALLAQLLGFNIGGALVRFYFDDDDWERRKRLIATAQIFFTLFVGVVTLFLALGAPLLAPALFGGDEFRVHFRLTMAILLLSAAAEPAIALMRAEQRSTFFVILAFSKMVIEIGLKVYLIAYLQFGVLGAIWGSVLAWIYAAAIPLVWLLGRSGFHFSFAQLKRLVGFTYPLILSGLSGFALHSADRYMIRWLGEAGGTENLNLVGIYGLAYKFGYLINFILLDPFLLIWFPYIFSIKLRERQQERNAQVASYLNALLIWASLGLALVMPEVVRIAAQKPEFYAADQPVPVILLGYVFWALYQMFHTGIFIEKRTQLLPRVVMTAALVNIGLNAVMIPRWGIMGAAWATVIAFVVLAALAYWRTQAIFPVRYEWRRLAGPLVLGVGLFLAGKLLDRLGPLGLAPFGLVGDLLLTACYPLVLWKCGFVRREEWGKVREALAALRHRFSHR